VNAPAGRCAGDDGDQKLSGCCTTGVQRAFFTTDRNDWLDA
jgi:hypothetical protein